MMHWQPMNSEDIEKIESNAKQGDKILVHYSNGYCALSWYYEDIKAFSDGEGDHIDRADIDWFMAIEEPPEENRG